ncbi:hypothetical protein GDO81_007183 [Engystomops pustulosus]|uniref:Uncharacterized protein n=1 Tax=Engystomops pustulosus TaxID=76066 RepID=A0AAV7C684_ENGPU|nr:hypothetical protein GDO81_007183 [Engystomops pustulosus]
MGKQMETFVMFRNQGNSREEEESPIQDSSEKLDVPCIEYTIRSFQEELFSGDGTKNRITSPVL